MFLGTVNAQGGSINIAGNDFSNKLLDLFLTNALAFYLAGNK